MNVTVHSVRFWSHGDQKRRRFAMKSPFGRWRNADLQRIIALWFILRLFYISGPQPDSKCLAAGVNSNKCTLFRNHYCERSDDYFSSKEVISSGITDMIFSTIESDK